MRGAARLLSLPSYSGSCARLGAVCSQTLFNQQARKPNVGSCPRGSASCFRRPGRHRAHHLLLLLWRHVLLSRRTQPDKAGSQIMYNSSSGMSCHPVLDMKGKHTCNYGSGQRQVLISMAGSSPSLVSTRPAEGCPRCSYSGCGTSRV